MYILYSSTILAASFVVLAVCADLFIEGAVGIADIFRIPRMIVGIFMVGFATTAPELVVSGIAAFQGHPEIALGNAVGSVICDDALALPFAALASSVPIFVNPPILKRAGLFLIFADLLAFALVLNGVFSRFEGLLLLMLLPVGIYIIYSSAAGEDKECPETYRYASKQDILINSFLFLSGLLGVFASGELIVWSATDLAESIGVPEAIIGLTLIAVGTSLPEIATCIVSGLKGYGDVAVGDIIGADILNVLWIIGMAAFIKPMEVDSRIVLFSFPWMIVIVVTMLAMLRIGYRMTRIKGLVLMALYAVYIVMTINMFY